MKKYKATITHSNSIEKLIKDLEEYRDGIQEKMQTFVSRLIDVGIDTANANSGEYLGMIKFEKVINQTKQGIEAVLVATDGRKIIREWKYKGGTKVAVVSPLLMAEFGSGWLAKVMSTQDYRGNELGVGQGTFPGQKHAFDKDGWWWETPDGVKHHSIGEAPTYPMYSAINAMLFEIDRIAKEVFGNG